MTEKDTKNSHELLQVQNRSQFTDFSQNIYAFKHSLMCEYNLLQQQNLPGIYVLPSERSPLLWFGIIFIREGIYEGGIFKFCLIIPPNYPIGGCPKVVFDRPAPFHPLIDKESCGLDVKRSFSYWNVNLNRIWNVLSCVKEVFSTIAVDNPLNNEAAYIQSYMYCNDIIKFQKTATENIKENLSRLFDRPNDNHELVFSMSQMSNVHTPRYSSMLSQGRENTYDLHEEEAASLQS